MNSFPERLRSEMDRLGFTQAKLAQKMGVPQGTVSRWLRGTVTPYQRYVEDAAKVLGVSTDWLLKGSEPKLPKGKVEQEVYNVDTSPMQVEDPSPNELESLSRDQKIALEYRALAFHYSRLADLLTEET